jgi:hypothetical protein
VPYTATTPSIVLCDALVTFLKDQWQPNAPNEVRRISRGQSIKYEESVGRHVCIFPIAYDARSADRGQDFYTHTIGVITYERYPDAADSVELIPDDWVDERIDFVHTQVFKGLDFSNDGVQPTFNRDLQTLEIGMEDIYSPEWFAAKVFWSRLLFLFEELEPK